MSSVASRGSGRTPRRTSSSRPRSRPRGPSPRRPRGRRCPCGRRGHQRRPRPTARHPHQNHMRRPPRTVEEVPGVQRPLLTLHDEEALAGEYEKVLLVALAVVHGHRLPGHEDVEVDPELLEWPLALEVAHCAERAVIAPAAVSSVQHEPAVDVCDEAEFRAPQRRLANRHRGNHTPEGGHSVITRRSAPL